MNEYHFVIIASKAGAPTNPDWYDNILANPLVAVETGTEQFQVQAVVAPEPDRTRLFNKIAEKYTCWICRILKIKLQKLLTGF